MGQLQVHALMRRCPVCIIKLLLLLDVFSDKLNDDVRSTVFLKMLSVSLINFTVSLNDFLGVC